MATNQTPAAWLAESDEVIATAIDVLLTASEKG